MAAIRPGRPAQAAAKKQAAPAPDAAPPPPPPAAPKGRGMTVPAIIIAVAILGGFFFFGKGGGGDGGTTTAAATATSVAPAEDGEAVALDPITLNLAGGDILKIGIALEVATEQVEHAKEDPRGFGASALDETIVVFSGYTREELLRSGGLAEAKKQLSERVKALYHDEVLKVYVTQFVIA